MALKDKDKKIISLVVCIFVILIDLVLILGWQARWLFRYYRLTNQRKQDITLLENDSKNLESHKQEIVNLDKEIHDLKFLIIEASDIPILIENISNLANSCGVRIKQIKPVTDIVDGSNLRTIETKDGRIGEIEIQVVAESSFHQLGNFVSKIESDRNFFRLSSLEIKTDNRDYMIQNIRISLISIVKLEEI